MSVEVFVDVCDQLLAKDILNWNYKMNQEGYTESIEIKQGKKYIKLIKHENGVRESLFGWIDMSNGDVLMGHTYNSRLWVACAKPSFTPTCTDSTMPSGINYTASTSITD